MLETAMMMEKKNGRNDAFINCTDLNRRYN